VQVKEKQRFVRKKDPPRPGNVHSRRPRRWTGQGRTIFIGRRAWVRGRHGATFARSVVSTGMKGQMVCLGLQIGTIWFCALLYCSLL